MTSLVGASLVLAFIGHTAFGVGVGPSFGVGYTPDQGFYCKGGNKNGTGKRDTVIFSHTNLDESSHAVLTHFWVTGPQYIVDRIWVSYYLDNETVPSISFQPSMMCGVAFPTLLQETALYNVANLCGKNAAIGGFHNSFPIPFKKNVVVTVRPDEQDGNCQWGYFNFRGTENLPLVFPQTGIPLPIDAKLQLQRNDWALRQPREFVNITDVPAGYNGMILMNSWAVEAKPVGGVAVGGGYIEGCWNLYGTSSTLYPGLVVGTGVEDYFDSSYYFGFDTHVKKGVTFNSDQAGLTIFDHSADNVTERLSAYRLHTSDPLVMTDGGRFTWQVGGGNVAGRTKCGNPKAASVSGEFLAGIAPLHEQVAGRELSPVNVTTYSWVYVWKSSVGDPTAIHV